MPQLRVPAVLVALVVAAASSAASFDLDRAAQSPTYEVRDVHCDGKDCKAIVSNENSVGVEVRGKGKKETRAKGEQKAEDLNKEAEEGDVEEEGLFDTCLRYPTLC